MLVLVSMLAGWAHPAAAQAGVRLSTLQVSLWPEYDRPSTLVILEGQLEPTVALPASLALRIPARAGQPHAVAVTDEGGQLLTAAYTTQPAGDDIIVMFQTEFQGFRVEYYDPALKSDGKARQYAFEWQTDYAIAAAAVRVQQPLGARDLAGEPALHSLGAVEDGLTYFEADWGALEPGDTASLRLSYAKTGSTLTAEALAAAPAPQAVTPAVQGNNLPWIIGGAALGLALAAGGVFAYTRPRRPAPAARQPTRRRSSAGRRRVKATPAAYCTQCGQRLVAGDRFCRNCGARAVVS